MTIFRLRWWMPNLQASVPHSIQCWAKWWNFFLQGEAQTSFYNKQVRWELCSGSPCFRPNLQATQHFWKHTYLFRNFRKEIQYTHLFFPLCSVSSVLFLHLLYITSAAVCVRVLFLSYHHRYTILWIESGNLFPSDFFNISASFLKDFSFHLVFNLWCAV